MIDVMIDHKFPMIFHWQLAPQPPSTAAIAPPPTPLALHHSPPLCHRGQWSWPPAKCLAPNFHGKTPCRLAIHWTPTKTHIKKRINNWQKKRPKNPNIFNFKSKQPQSAVSKSPFVLAPFERLRALKWSGCKKCNANVLSIWCFMNCYTASLIHGMSLSSFSQKFPVKIQRKLLKLFVQSRFRSCFISWNWKQPQNESIPFIVASWIHWRCLGWTHENMCPSNSWELNLPIAREVSPVSWPQIIAPLHLTTILIEWRVDSHSHLHKNQWSMDVPNVYCYNTKNWCFHNLNFWWRLVDFNGFCG